MEKLFLFFIALVGLYGVYAALSYKYRQAMEAPVVPEKGPEHASASEGEALPQPAVVPPTTAPRGRPRSGTDAGTDTGAGVGGRLGASLTRFKDKRRAQGAGSGAVSEDF